MGISGFMTAIASELVGPWIVVTTASPATGVGNAYACNATAQAQTPLLPTGTSVGQMVVFAKTDATNNSVTPTPGGADTIATSGLAVMNTQGEARVLVSDGATPATWHVISGAYNVSGYLTAGQAAATYAPIGVFAASYRDATAYTAGQPVTHGGALWFAKNSFTSGAGSGGSSWNATQWTQVAQSVVLDSLATDIQPAGARAVGATGLGSDAGHVHPAFGWRLSDVGYLAWNISPWDATLGSALTSGVVVAPGFPVFVSTVVTNFVLQVTTQGTGAFTAGQSEAGVFSMDGTVRYGFCKSADVVTALTSAPGMVSIPVYADAAYTSPTITLAPGNYRFGVFGNWTGGVAPAVARGASAAVNNGGKTGNAGLWVNCQTINSGTFQFPTVTPFLTGFAASLNAVFVGAQ